MIKYRRSYAIDVGILLLITSAKGSLKNKLAILSVEAPGWQGAKVQEYQAYSELSQRSQAGCIGT